MQDRLYVNLFITIGITSVIGVGFGLCDSIKNSMGELNLNPKLRNFIGATLTILPPFIVAILVPNAFITVLGFAGMILALIAILMPIYLLNNIKVKKFHYPELRFNSLLIVSFAIGMGILLCEVFNMLIG